MRIRWRGRRESGRQYAQIHTKRINRSDFLWVDRSDGLHMGHQMGCASAQLLASPSVQQQNLPVSHAYMGCKYNVSGTITRCPVTPVAPT